MNEAAGCGARGRRPRRRRPARGRRRRRAARPDRPAPQAPPGHQWCVLHPATSETGPATWGDAGLPGLSDCDASLGGDGSPAVAAFVAEPLGAAMGVSTQAAMALMADALDLHHRLPRLWSRAVDFAGTSWLDVAGDSRDLAAFHDLVCAEATALGRLGDTDDYEARKAKALGVIAARQATLELTGEAPDGRPVTRRPVETTLHLHLSLSDLAIHLADGTPVVGEAERLGPVTVDLIRTWLTDARATIRPVLDLDRTDAYDDTGPPGQTSPDNLAALCRRHHRAKTFAGWRYRRRPDGSYAWTDPHGRAYIVGPDGTTVTTSAPARVSSAAYTLAT